ncbi:MAG: hypothetical protein FWC80_06905 [Firmicutes bacterium]|nr:hypothetical protein [Bacillota bacterium]
MKKLLKGFTLVVVAVAFMLGACGAITELEDGIFGFHRARLVVDGLEINENNSHRAAERMVDWIDESVDVLLSQVADNLLAQLIIVGWDLFEDEITDAINEVVGEQFGYLWQYFVTEYDGSFFVIEDGQIARGWGDNHSWLRFEDFSIESRVIISDSFGPIDTQQGYSRSLRVASQNRLVAAESYNLKYLVIEALSQEFGMLLNLIELDFSVIRDFLITTETTYQRQAVADN